MLGRQEVCQIPQGKYRNTIAKSCSLCILKLFKVSFLDEKEEEVKSLSVQHTHQLPFFNFILAKD